MSGTANPHGGMTRRGFLKATGITAGAVGLAGAASMISADGWLAHADSAQDMSKEKVAHTFHQNHCHGSCSLKCTARDGRLCLIQPNDWENDSYHNICLKGISEVQHVYSVERIQTPLKRVGERGSGEFVSISWDEAAQEIKDNLLPIVEKYGGQCVLIPPALEPLCAQFTGTILGAQNMGSWIGLDLGWGNGLAYVTGDTGTLDVTGGWNDVKYSKTLLNIGGNPLETRLVYGKEFFDAVENGTYVITVDPHFSTTAGKSDKWVPVKPGTDGALLLGMISLVLDNEWYDHDYIMANTGFDFLIDVETGKYYLIDGKCAVWDSQSAVPVVFDQEGIQPVLDGKFEHDGKKYQTVFAALKDSQKQYSVDWASEVTGIPASDIYEITKQYATCGPSAMNLGFGVDKYANADILGHAAGILTAMTGNFGIHGGCAGNITSGKEPYGIKLGGWKLPDQYKSAAKCENVFDLPYKDNGVKAAIFFSGLFVLRHADLNAAKEWIKTLDYVIMTDIYASPDTAFADLVLPVCTKFECNEEYGAVRVKGGRVMLQEKILDPLFESKTDFQIERFFAEILGAEQYLPATSEEWVRAQLEGAKGTDGLTLEDLVANQGIYEVFNEVPPIQYENQIYKTKSGKLQPYAEDMLEFGQALPQYEPPNEVGEDNELADEYPLAFVTPHSKFHIHLQFVDAEWIRQFFGPVVNLNPVEMRSRNLEDGDIVEVFNDRGSFKCRVHGTEVVRPGSASIIEAIWDKYLVEGNIQNVTNPAIPERAYSEPLGPVIAFNDTRVEVKKAGM